MLWGSDVKMLDIGITKETTFILEGVCEGGILVKGFDLVAALVGAVLVAVLAVFFQYTRVGRALRAVADDHQAALSVGIRSEEHTSELQSLMRISYAVFCLKKKIDNIQDYTIL